MRIAVSALLLIPAACDPGVRTETYQRSQLSAELAGRQAGEPVECIDTNGSQGLDIASRDTLVYRTGTTTYVNRLGAPCAGLRPYNQLIVEPATSGRYCRNDRIRAVEAGTNVRGPICLLGRFTPYPRR